MLTTVMVNGCFDTLHIGHVNLFAWASVFGNIFVALNSDESVKRLKGPTRPVFKQEDRKQVLLALRDIANVIIFEEDTPEQVIEIINPEIVVVGYDHSMDDDHYVKAKRYGRVLKQAPYFPSKKIIYEQNHCYR